MREIKCRYVWKNGVDFTSSIVFMGNSVVTPPPKLDGVNFRCWELVGRYQYAGLKDCNGVEIYEGDIVSIQYDFDEPTIHKVEWGGIDYPAFEFTPQLNCECNGFAHYYNDPDTIVEVIGNIHQNPELLEG